MRLKNYVFKTVKGAIHYLGALNNRDAMKQVGKLIKWCGDILWLKDEYGKEIIYNKHLEMGDKNI